MKPMDEDVIQDFKQFIAATLSQQFSNYITKDDIANFATKDDLTNFATKDDIAELVTKSDLKKLETKIDDIQNAINDSVIPFVQIVDDQVQDHEKRLVKLELKPA